MFDRDLLSEPSVVVGPRLLGARLTSTVDGGRVVIEITEVEAYQGVEDPGSHAFRGLTARNQVMFGPAGHLYVYFTYGMHWCANIVTGQAGAASGCLVRAGRVVEGVEVARIRRPASTRDRDLARGPARLASALGITGVMGGHDLAVEPVRLDLPDRSLPLVGVRTGPRVGLSGPGGDGQNYPWRFWVDGDPTVSMYRPAVARKR